MNRIAAIIWDYDGTLVDTKRKNLSVTRAIISEITCAEAAAFPALCSLEAYERAMLRSTNWRDFYKREFSLIESDIDVAGRMWTEFQIRDCTPITVFDGIHEVLYRLRHLPHGIVSQNSRDAIVRVLDGSDLLQYFSCIVGFEEVEIRRQKPEPDGLFHCLGGLTVLNGDCVLYIGDHETDAASAHNANQILRTNKSHFHLRSIGALYSSPRESVQWQIKPDYEAREVHDILRIIDSIRD